MRTVLSLVLLALLPALLFAQDIGGWEIIYAADDEMLLMLQAAEFRGDERPLLHLHCRVGAAPRVFFRPFVESVQVQFDDGELQLERFAGDTYGFYIQGGKLLEETEDTGRVPLRSFGESVSLLESIATAERMTVRFQRVSALGTAAASRERNYFELNGLAAIFDALGNPCAQK